LKKRMGKKRKIGLGTRYELIFSLGWVTIFGRKAGAHKRVGDERVFTPARNWAEGNGGSCNRAGVGRDIARLSQHPVAGKKKETPFKKSKKGGGGGSKRVSKLGGTPHIQLRQGET